MPAAPRFVPVKFHGQIFPELQAEIQNNGNRKSLTQRHVMQLDWPIRDELHRFAELWFPAGANIRVKPNGITNQQVEYEIIPPPPVQVNPNNNALQQELAAQPIPNLNQNNWNNNNEPEFNLNNLNAAAGIVAATGTAAVSVANAQHMGNLTVEAETMNSVSYENIEDGEDVIVLMNDPRFVQKRKSIEDWFQTRRNQGLPPTNPLSGEEITQQNQVRRYTARIPEKEGGRRTKKTKTKKCRGARKSTRRQGRKSRK